MIKNVIIAVLAILILATLALHYGLKTGKTKYKQKPKSEYSYEILTSDTGLKGYLLLTASSEPPASVGSAYIMDMSGRICVKRTVKGSIANFQQIRLRNGIFYSYMVIDTVAPFKCSEVIPQGHLVLLDSGLNEIRQIHLVPGKEVNRDHNQDLDTHGAVILADNHFLVLLNYMKKVNNMPDSLHPAKDIKVVSCMIQETIDGKVVWQWDATEFPEFYSNATNRFTDTIIQDYIHANSIIVDPADSNVIVSFRNLNQVLKINRKSGAIMWRLGGKNSDFPLAKEQIFLRQHALILDSNKTLIFLDNGDKLTRPYSRIVEFKLDEKNKKVNSFKAYKIPHLQIERQGNVAREGKNYLIGGGSAKYILLVDPITDEYLFHMRSNMRSYVVHKVDSIYGLEKNIK
jgi:arylsulfate sulfotransferase